MTALPTTPTVVIGGGIVGACSAWHLADHGPVVVLERDPTYRFASTTLSTAAIRTQFSLAVNVRMSLFGDAFLERLDAAPGGGIGRIRRGYLTLAGPAGEDQLRANHAMQTGQGAQVEWLAPAALAARYPWLRVDDLAGATYGRAHEGWFDAWALLRAVRAEAIAKGARFLHAEAVGIDLAAGRAAAVRTQAGERIAAGHVVIAAGAASGRVAAWAGVALPVAPRKRTVFVLKAPLDGAGMPLVFDTSGAWIRPEGDGFLAGISPPEDADPDAAGDFEPDMAQLEALLWEPLAHRIPAFERLRVQSAWAGHYDMCTLDHNAVIGTAPGIANLVIASGFSGHGVQHGPATGRAVAELIRHGRYVTLDLSELSYDRVAEGRALWELAVY